MSDTFRGISDFRAIQTLPDDLQGHAHHVFMDVALNLFLPRIQHAAGGARHYLRVRQDTLAVKGRLNEAALALPKISLAGQ